MRMANVAPSRRYVDVKMVGSHLRLIYVGYNF
jgi:hypothetical protein